MYWVHLDSGANQGEIPGIGESPSNQPMGHLRIRHLARTNRNALGGKGFGGNIFVAHGGNIFAISVSSLTSSFPVFFLFRAMENPPTSAAELDSDPDSPHLDQFSLLWWSAVVSTGPVSLIAQPSAPS